MKKDNSPAPRKLKEIILKRETLLITSAGPVGTTASMLPQTSGTCGLV
jgi:hypothetical protein